MAEKNSAVEALAAVMAQVRAVRKGDRNTQQNYNFRGIDAVMNAVGPALRDHGVVVMPVCEEAHYRDVTTSTGKPSRECTVKVRYRFYGPAGDFVECVTPGESMDVGDKGAPKAMSVAYRIALLQALCLPTDDADPDSTSYERADREVVETPPGDDPSVLRARIAKTGEHKGMTADEILADFIARTQGKHIRHGTVPELQAYLSWLEKQPDKWEAS